MLFKSLLIATIASTHAFVPPTAGARSTAHSRAAVVVSGASVVEAPVVATAERKPCFSGDAYGRAAWAAPTVPKKAAAEKKAAPAPAPTPVMSKEDEAAKAARMEAVAELLKSADIPRAGPLSVPSRRAYSGSCYPTRAAVAQPSGSDRARDGLTGAAAKESKGQTLARRREAFASKASKGKVERAARQAERARAADPRVSPPARVAGLKPGAALAKRRAEGLRGPEFRDARIKRARDIGISAASASKATAKKMRPLAWNDNKAWLARVDADGVGDGWYAAGLRLSAPARSQPVPVTQAVTAARRKAGAARQAKKAAAPAQAAAKKSGGFSLNPFKKADSAKADSAKADEKPTPAVAVAEEAVAAPAAETATEEKAEPPKPAGGVMGDPFIASDFDGFKDGYTFKSAGEKGKGYYKK